MLPALEWFELDCSFPCDLPMDYDAAGLTLSQLHQGRLQMLRCVADSPTEATAEARLQSRISLLQILRDNASKSSLLAGDDRSLGLFDRANFTADEGNTTWSTLLARADRDDSMPFTGELTMVMSRESMTTMVRSQDEEQRQQPRLVALTPRRG